MEQNISENKNLKYLFANPNARFLDLIFKFTKKHYNPLFFQKDLTDKEFFQYFVKIYKPEINSNILIYRATKRYKDLEKFLDINKYIVGDGLYLDIGCADGLITDVLGKKLGFKEENIYATDIFQPELLSNINFVVNDEKSIPLDKKFQLVTLFQSLHHMRFLDKMLAEIDRITITGSYLVIREHNLGQDKLENNRLFMLEHAFYEIVYDGKTYEQFIEDYYAKYYTESEWDSLLSKIGFKKIKKYYIPKFNPTNYYYAIFIKQ